MSSLQYINPKADLLRKSSALNMNINASKGLQEVLKSNIGPKGTLKMLVSGGGQIKITKDGYLLAYLGMFFSMKCKFNIPLLL